LPKQKSINAAISNCSIHLVHKTRLKLSKASYLNEEVKIFFSSEASYLIGVITFILLNVGIVRLI
jgi:hypothetical protein